MEGNPCWSPASSRRVLILLVEFLWDRSVTRHQSRREECSEQKGRFTDFEANPLAYRIPANSAALNRGKSDKDHTL